MTFTIRVVALAFVASIGACAQSPTGPTTTPAATITDPGKAAPPPRLTCADVSGRLERHNNDHDTAWGVLTKPVGTFAHELVTLASTRDGVPFDWDTAWSTAPWYLDSDRTWAYIDTPVTGQWTVTLTCGGRILAQWTS